MDNLVLNIRREKTIPFNEWFEINMDNINEILYTIMAFLDSASIKYKFTINEDKLYEDVAKYLYATSSSKYKNYLNLYEFMQN